MPNRHRLCAVLAALGFLVIALFVLRGALASPGRLLPYPELLDWNSNSRMDLTRLDHRDQSMVVSVVTRNAAILTSEPWNLFDGYGQCFPLPRSYTLGEHMFGTGLLAALPYALTQDPLLSYNAALVLTLWIPALAMYALAYHFTRSPAAAFVAGMLFQLVPGRVVDPSHPYVHGDLWVPLVVLFLHRLFTRERWSDALLFALFVSLEVFESLYPLLACSLIVVVYGAVLAVRHRARLVALLPKIALASALILVATWVVLGPYLATRDAWGLLEGRTSLLLRVRDYGWGSIYFPGATILGLALLGLADRLRGPRRVDGEDPRLALFAAGFVVFWSSTSGMPLPFLDVKLASPIEMLKPYVPGLNAVRALNAIGITANLAWAFLGAYGTLMLIERRRAAVANGAAAALTTLALTSLYWEPLAKPMFSVRTFRLAPWIASPPGQDVELMRRTAERAVLDVPFPEMDTPASVHLARHLLLNAYDPRATAACYNSFVSPVQRQVLTLSEQLPDRGAADALAALGFGTIVIDKVRVDPANLEAFYEGLHDLDNAQRIYPVGKTGRLLAYRLDGGTPARSDFAMLSGDTEAPVQALPMKAEVAVELPFANRDDDATFRLPDPITTSDVIVTWYDERGRAVRATTSRELLPMAIGPRARFPVTLQLEPPLQPGRYRVTLARSAEPERILASRDVDLLPAT